MFRHTAHRLLECNSSTAASVHKTEINGESGFQLAIVQREINSSTERRQPVLVIPIHMRQILPSASFQIIFQHNREQDGKDISVYTLTCMECDYRRRLDW